MLELLSFISYLITLYTYIVIAVVIVALSTVASQYVIERDRRAKAGNNSNE